MNGQLTTDRPLSNDDRQNLWRDKWRIESNPKPIPSRAHDWDWHHASSAADAIQQINEITSPAVQGQPQGVNLATCIRDALGFVLVMTVCVAFVGLLGMQAGVW
jgi:hypothetical protein